MPPRNTEVHHAGGLFVFVEYWTKFVVQRLLEIIGDLALFLINVVTVSGFTIEAWLCLRTITDGLRYTVILSEPPLILIDEQFISQEQSHHRY